MRFHSVVVQRDGVITERRRWNSETVRDNASTASVVNHFAALLRQHLTADPERCGVFRTQVAEPQACILQWRQAEPMSALASLTVAGTPTVDCLMLYGFEPMLDARAVHAMQLVTAQWAKQTGSDPGPSLLTIKDRPLVATFPAPGDCGALRSEFLSDIPACLATVFFERGDARHEMAVRS